eukprot:TRINITY_DN3425_c0_g2_i5.p1 TRINITY_DN3425_c0_g2~~TRINITY_DN3425_c0_g2_i5.p1  ORF type:complete len:300 (-),score=57.48 TRINITY_DN3425_c0_g2_i5:333-1232(-)
MCIVRNVQPTPRLRCPIDQWTSDENSPWILPSIERDVLKTAQGTHHKNAQCESEIASHYVEIINKPFVRKKIVQYLSDCMKCSGPDIDPADMYIEGLKVQAAQLGIHEVLEGDTGFVEVLPHLEEEKVMGKGKRPTKQAGGPQTRTKGPVKKQPEHLSKLKNIKQELKEKQVMEEQLAQLKEQRRKKLEEYKQKMKQKGKSTSSTTSKSVSSTKENKDLSIEEQKRNSLKEKKVEEIKQEKPPIGIKKGAEHKEEVSRLNKSEFNKIFQRKVKNRNTSCLLYTSPSPRDLSTSRMPSSA